MKNISQHALNIRTRPLTPAHTVAWVSGENPAHGQFHKARAVWVTYKSATPALRGYRILYATI